MKKFYEFQLVFAANIRVFHISFQFNCAISENQAIPL